MKQSTLNNGGHETMTKRFLLANSDYDLKYEMRIADLTRVDKTKEDFFNEENDEYYNYVKFREYLYANNAFLTKDEAEKVLNEQDQKIKDIEKLLDNELKKAFNNRINHDDYAEDAELAEYFKGYHCGVGDLEKKIRHILFNE